jgi:hypothetical protein
MALRRQEQERTGRQERAPVELRLLARLELKKRRILSELAEVHGQYEQLAREIELKGIPIPWLS